MSAKAARERRVAELVAARPLTPLVRELSFEVREGSPIAYTAGQWVNLYLPGGDGDPLQRSYSLASAPGARPTTSAGHTLTIAVTRVPGGPASNALHEMAVGTRLELDGPWGIFTRKRAPADAPRLYVATGTGLTPIRAMLQEDLVAQDGPATALLFGCRTEEDILWRAELDALARDHRRFRYEITLSQPSTDWHGWRGYVQSHLAELVRPVPGVHVFVCGVRAMIDDVRDVLKDTLGLDRKRIHTERYD